MTVTGNGAGPDRIRSAFATASQQQRAAFIAYVVAGYPSADDAVNVAEAALEAGADLLEIGIPFTDPMADGPVIAAASRAALAAGGGLQSAVDLARALRQRGATQPILAMSYLNPLLAHGAVEALGALAAAGVDGLIVPDLPVGEDPAFERAVAAHGLAISFLVAPNTPPPRLEEAVTASSAFLYVVPLLGVTGARDSLADGAVELIVRIRKTALGRAPVVAGFGISAASQVARLAEVADGVVVGSALVRALASQNGHGEGAARVGVLVRELSAATRITLPAAKALR
ncbi:MAG TPA: tryptophan synthase subunit alpha [Candidatus Limnocylindrales bacterium]|nr:tryptophan synthase subunit alpha [Candidatus Limnocylindrales bacterium]